MDKDVSFGVVELGVLGKLSKRKPAKKDVLRRLDAIEKSIHTARMPTSRKITALYLVGALKSKTRKYWVRLSKGEGAFLIEDDMVRLRRILDDPLKEYSSAAAGISKEEKNMNALFRWMEEELSFPEDCAIEYIMQKIDEMRADAESLGNEIILHEFEHNASKLRDAAEHRIAALRKIKTKLNRYV